jgi:hypothetical protein
MKRTHVIPLTDVLSTELPGQEVVLLHIQRGEYYTLNETGALIWQGIQQQQALEAVSQTLAARYGLTPEAAHTHVMQLVEELATEQLVTLV